MGIYQAVMGGGKQAAAPGTAAATDAVEVPNTLPDMTPDLYQQIWGTDPGANPATVVTTHGADSRGPAMHDEDLGGTAPGQAGAVIRAARAMVGTPYVWGGTSKSGVDCSGLMQIAFKAAGIDLPRLSYQQVNSGQRVSAGQARAGDLVGFDNSSRNPGADHVALYLGGGRILEAARPGTKVRIRKLGRNEGAFFSRVL